MEGGEGKVKRGEEFGGRGGGMRLTGDAPELYSPLASPAHLWELQSPTQLQHSYSHTINLQEDPLGSAMDPDPEDQAFLRHYQNLPRSSRQAMYVSIHTGHCFALSPKQTYKS